MIKLEKVTVKFSKGFLKKGENIYALHDISTEINSSTIVIGESGAGKTTLARVLLGLQKISEGKYFYNDINVWRNKRKALKIIRREIQYVAQDPYASFNPNKTIGESLGYVVKKYYGRKNYKEKVIKLLESVGLTENEYYKYPHQMSGGQLQRANIARSLIPNPKILIADEPTSMLDASYRVSIINLLSDLVKKGLEVIIITHDLAIARYFANQIGGAKSLILYKGRLVEEGNFENILKNPLHPYTQFLINSIIDIRGETKEIKLNDDNVPPPINGCPFYPYCSFRREICKESFPTMKEIDNHKVACYNY
ncbi:ABC transporter ATP-binding protein [Sulfurisphaera javensis]|uniref:ABC transporter ATP-binding protein n=1 Tax=Sulfurisphaera javensis TaxID=2049879 RepID=UPI0034E8B7E0